MSRRLQWKTSIVVDAPRERVWAIADDISAIPSYHPEVRKVDLLSGRSTRALGVRYRCTIPEGRKGSCVEEVVGYVPGESVTTAFPEDTWGLSEMLADFVVETSLHTVAGGRTLIRLEAHYRPVGLRMKLANALFLKRVMARRSHKVLEGIKRLAAAG